MVAGDHLDVDSGAMTQRNGVTSFSSSRVDNAYKEFEPKVADPIFRVGNGAVGVNDLRSRNATCGNSKNSHALGGECIVLRTTEPQRYGVERLFRTIGFREGGRHSKDNIGCALYADQDIAIR